jgi:hypothetical protein
MDWWRLTLAIYQLMTGSTLGAHLVRLLRAIAQGLSTPLYRAARRLRWLTTYLNYLIHLRVRIQLPRAIKHSRDFQMPVFNRFLSDSTFFGPCICCEKSPRALYNLASPILESISLFPPPGTDRDSPDIKCHSLTTGPPTRTKRRSSMSVTLWVSRI